MEPQTLGLRRSFGFGDRLGLATPGHIEAARKGGFAPLFAQQSIREMQRTARPPEEVMATAARAVAGQKWDKPWGADADHLHTREDVAATVRAGFTLFTIDPSAHIRESPGPKDGNAGPGPEEALDLYLGKRFDLGPGLAWEFADRSTIEGILVKYGKALAHIRSMHGWIQEACAGRDHEVEVSVDETSSPTSPLEHLFIGLELRRMGLSISGLAPRFIGAFEKGVDYRGNPDSFAVQFREHIAIARFCGPYRISVHSGSDKFMIYPLIGKLAGELLHVKTAGTSYLEALRVICRTDKALFREIAGFSRARYERDRATYHVSAQLCDIPENVADPDLENTWLDQDAGRQVLHVGYGSVLTEGKRESGAGFREAIWENLSRNDSLHRECLVRHLGRHLELLARG
jgi:hypothetical protein